MDKTYVISKCGLRGKFHVEMKTYYTAMDAVCCLADLVHETYCELNVKGLHSYMRILYKQDPEKILEHYHELIQEHNYHDKVEFSIGLEVIERMVESKPESYHDSEEKFWDDLSTHNERFAYD